MHVKQSETALRKPFINALRNVGALVIPYVGSTYGVAGTSDVFVAHVKWHGWIEFKGPKTKVEAVQQHFIDEMLKRKVNAFVVRLFPNNWFEINGQKHLYMTGWEILDALCKNG